MKLRNFFCAALAACFAFVSCDSDENLGMASLELSASSLSFGVQSDSKTITLKATRDWTLKTYDAAWLRVNPNSGSASSKDQTVTISVTENMAGNRNVDLEFTIGTYTKKLKVTQEGPQGDVGAGSGDGTLASPYSAAKALEVTNALPKDGTKADVYVTGVVSSFKEEFNASYGNMTFYITEKDGTGEFLVYRMKSFNNAKFTSADELKVGDEIVAYGTLQNYYGNTPELKDCKMITKNGQTPEPEVEEVNEFTSTLKWELGSNSYDEDATVNSLKVSHLLKVGKSKEGGSATVTIPSGTTKVGFYAIGWKGTGTNTKLTCAAGDATQEFTLTGNDGATNNAPYTITLAESDYYTFDIPSGATQMTISTTGTSNCRAIIIALKPVTE